MPVFNAFRTVAIACCILFSPVIYAEVISNATKPTEGARSPLHHVSEFAIYVESPRKYYVVISLKSKISDAYYYDKNADRLKVSRESMKEEEKIADVITAMKGRIEVYYDRTGEKVYEFNLPYGAKGFYESYRGYDGFGWVGLSFSESVMLENTGVYLIKAELNSEDEQGFGTPLISFYGVHGTK